VKKSGWLLQVPCIGVEDPKQESYRIADACQQRFEP